MKNAFQQQFLRSCILAAVFVLTGALTSLGQAAILNVPGDHTTIQAAIDAAAAGDTIVVAAGSYAENIVLAKSLTLQGAKAGIAACDRDPSSESIISPAISPAARLLELRTGSAGSVIDGFTFSGGPRHVESTSGPIDDIQILNNRFVAFTGSALFLNDTGVDITVDRNLVNGSNSPSGGAVHLDQDNFDGFHFTSNCVSNGNTGFLSMAPVMWGQAPIGLHCLAAT